MIRIAPILTAPLLLAAAGIPAGLESQAEQYNAERPKTIVELQQFRSASSVRVRSGAGNQGIATLVNLNPKVNAWFLLSVIWSNAASSEPAWHLENPKPREAQILLDEKYPSAIVIAEGNNRYPCDLFGSANALEQGRNSSLIYSPLCGGRLYLRNPAVGRRTALESATDFIRNQLWGGEKVIILFHHLLGERYRETGEVRSGGAPSNSGTPAGPVPALLDPAQSGRVVTTANLGIALKSPGLEAKGLVPGAWYPAAGNPGIYVSIMQPNFMPAAILQSYKKLVNNLDNVEASSLCYLIAFDLDRFELGFALGTGHPRIVWSDRALPKMRDSSLPGPDGVGSIAPLISTGLIAPENGRRTVATFTGGFKRTHGAFRYGDLALVNHGSHYGFIENGVVFSKLQPGLATLFTLNDGSIRMKTWTEEDNALLPGVRHARQNGVPLVEFDEAAHATVPGRLVNQWGGGNWSGSADEKLRTLRGGVALQKSGGKNFLIYAVFSDATPSAMARIFQAYQCDYAMLLDMNALEHTYAAVYRRSGPEMSVDHLLKGMSQLDKASSGEVVPRFLGYPDNRDFFYVMRRNAKETRP